MINTFFMHLMHETLINFIISVGNFCMTLTRRFFALLWFGFHGRTAILVHLTRVQQQFAASDALLSCAALLCSALLYSALLWKFQTGIVSDLNWWIDWLFERFHLSTTLGSSAKINIVFLYLRRRSCDPIEWTEEIWEALICTAFCLLFFTNYKFFLFNKRTFCDEPLLMNSVSSRFQLFRRFFFRFFRFLFFFLIFFVLLFFGFFFVFFDVFGCLWIIWMYLDAFVCLCMPLDAFACLWSSLDAFKCLWMPLDYFRLALNAFECLWISLVVSGCIRISLVVLNDFSCFKLSLVDIWMSLIFFFNKYVERLWFFSSSRFHWAIGYFGKNSIWLQFGLTLNLSSFFVVKFCIFFLFELIDWLLFSLGPFNIQSCFSLFKVSMTNTLY